MYYFSTVQCIILIQWVWQRCRIANDPDSLLLNDAIASADAAAPWARPCGGKPIYTRDQVAQLYHAHQQGAYEWVEPPSAAGTMYARLPGVSVRAIMSDARHFATLNLI